MPRFPAQAYLSLLWSLFAILLPCFWILPGQSLTTLFPQDWENQLWMFAYQARHWAETGQPASVLNFTEATGCATPLFYGTLIYPLGGLLALLTGPAWAVRLFILATQALLYSSIVRVGLASGWTTRYRHTIATLMAWTIYPVTNLYSRGALPEFWAWCFLIAAICSFLLLRKNYDNTSRSSLNYDAFAWGFYFLLAWTTHPITGVLGGGLLALLALSALLSLPHPAQKPFFFHLGATSAAIFLIQAFWINLMLDYGPHLHVLAGSNTAHVFQILANLSGQNQSVLTPLNPFSYAYSTVDLDIFFGTRVSTSLLVLLIFAILISNRSFFSNTPSRWLKILALAGTSLALIAYLILTVPAVAITISPLLGFLQFPYRLANYVNLGLFLALLAWPELRAWKWHHLLVIGTIALAGFSLIDKLSLVKTAPNSGDRWLTWTHADATGSVSSSYGRYDYAVVAGLTEVPLTAPPLIPFFPPHTALDAPERTLTLPTPTRIFTPILPFPYNQVLLDGKEIRRTQLHYYILDKPDKPPGLALDLPAGTQRIRYHFNPPLSWQIFHALSFTLPAIWGILVLVLGSMSFFKKCYEYLL